MKNSLFFVFLIIFSVFWFFISASGFCGEMNISAQKMEILENEGIVAFNGNVYAVKDDLKLWCDKLYIYYSQNSPSKNKKIKKLVAIGRVIIEKGEWKAYAGKAVYFKDTETLVLEDFPKVWKGKTLIEGDIVKIYFNEEKGEVISKGEGKVRVNFHEK